jgi:hypothetical protein
MVKFKIPLALQILLFLIPLNIYVIGDWMGSGIQTLFFRYNQTNIGNSLIFFNREIGFVIHGIIHGKSAFATIIWFVGVALICFAMLVVIYAYFREEMSLIKYSAFLNIGGAFLFTIAIVIQYGLLFHGPSGFAIPLGIPVILGVAYGQYKWNPATEEDEQVLDQT